MAPDHDSCNPHLQNDNIVPERLLILGLIILRLSAHNWVKQCSDVQDLSRSKLTFRWKNQFKLSFHVSLLKKYTFRSISLQPNNSGKKSCKLWIFVEVIFFLSSVIQNYVFTGFKSEFSGCKSEFTGCKSKKTNFRGEKIITSTKIQILPKKKISEQFGHK